MFDEAIGLRGNSTDWKRLKCAQIRGWLKKLCYGHATEYQSAGKGKNWMDPWGVSLRKKSQAPLYFHVNNIPEVTQFRDGEQSLAAGVGGVEGKWI